MSDLVTDALRRGDPAAAVNAAQERVQAHPADAEAHHLLGLALRMAGDSAAATASIERAIELAPDQPLFHMTRSALAMHAGDLAGADAALDQVVALDPNRLQAYVAQSQLALARGDIAEAEQRLLRALRIADEDPQVLLGLGNLRLAQGDLDAALKAFTHAVRVAPTDAAAHSCLGVAYLRRGMLDFAEQALRNALSQQPRLGSARRALIEVLLRAQRHDAAAAEARTLLQADPGNATAWRLLGDIELAAGHPEPAAEALQKALELAPQDLRALGTLAELWQRNGDPGRARDLLEARVQADPSSDAVWQMRLIAEHGNRSGSVAVATQWQAARPDSGAANEALAQIVEASGDTERAERLAEAALLLDDSLLAAQLIKARAEIRRAPEQALARLQPLVTRVADGRLRRSLLGWLGHAADAADRPEEAVQHWLAGHALSDFPGRLPPLGEVDQRLDDAIANATPGAADALQPPPVLLLGAPGGGSERLAALLRGQAERPLLDDRFSGQGREDRFMRPEYARWMAGDVAAMDELGSSWRGGLASRGLTGVAVVEWLQRWDARFLPAIAHALPGTRFLIAMRDPRDTLLNWLAFGAPQRWPVRDLQKTAEWLALALAHLWEIGQGGAAQVVDAEGGTRARFSQAVVSLEEFEQQPEQVLPRLCAFLELSEPPNPAPYLQSLTATAGWPTAVQAGTWRRYQQVLAAPFDALRPVIRAFGYPES